MEESIYKRVNDIQVKGPRHAAALIIHAKIQSFNGVKTPKFSTIYRAIRKLSNGRYILCPKCDHTEYSSSL